MFVSEPQLKLRLSALPTAAQALILNPKQYAWCYRRTRYTATPPSLPGNAAPQGHDPLFSLPHLPWVHCLVLPLACSCLSGEVATWAGRAHRSVLPFSSKQAVGHLDPKAPSQACLPGSAAPSLATSGWHWISRACPHPYTGMPPKPLLSHTTSYLQRQRRTAGPPC